MQWFIDDNLSKYFHQVIICMRMNCYNGHIKLLLDCSSSIQNNFMHLHTHTHSNQKGISYHIHAILQEGIEGEGERHKHTQYENGNFMCQLAFSVRCDILFCCCYSSNRYTKHNALMPVYIVNFYRKRKSDNGSYTYNIYIYIIFV